LIVVSTRPHNLVEEAERSARLTASAARGLLGRAVILNAAQGDLNDLIQYAEPNSRNLLEHRLSSAEAERLSSQEERRRGRFSGDGEVVADALPSDRPQPRTDDRSDRP
jgi:hypothetical protein